MDTANAMHELSFTYQIDPEPSAVSGAREQIRKVLPGWGLAEHDDLMQLIVSELVTNALPQCDYPIEITVTYDGKNLRIEVWDDGDQMPVRKAPGDDEERGRGLQLIDALIQTYGGTRGIARQGARCGKAVYVAIPTPRSAAWQRGAI